MPDLIGFDEVFSGLGIPGQFGPGVDEVAQMFEEAEMGMRGGLGSEVMVVTVEKTKLIQILTTNKNKHVDEFKKACEIYKTKLKEEYKDFLKKIDDFLTKVGEADVGLDKVPHAPHFSSKLPRPTSYEDHYTRALGMLELHTDDKMTIDMTTYRTYVEDEWEWAAQARLSNSSYLSG
jgi:hypothetical protein